MFARVARSVLVGLGWCMVALLLEFVGCQIYVSHFIPHPPGIGAVAGGIGPSLFVLPVVFGAGFAWHWWLSRRQNRSAKLIP